MSLRRFFASSKGELAALHTMRLLPLVVPGSTSPLSSFGFTEPGARLSEQLSYLAVLISAALIFLYIFLLFAVMR